MKAGEFNQEGVKKGGRLSSRYQSE